MAKVHIQPLRWYEKLADLLMIPIMKFIMIIAGHPQESTQRTHYWNNWKGNFDYDESIAVLSEGNKNSPSAGGLKRHLPPPFGWNHYLVLQPRNNPQARFYIGWVDGGVSEVSRLPSVGQVRVLERPEPVVFVGFDSNGNQIPIEVIGRGTLGYHVWQDVPLL